MQKSYGTQFYNFCKINIQQFFLNTGLLLPVKVSATRYIYMFSSYFTFSQKNVLHWLNDPLVLIVQ